MSRTESAYLVAHIDTEHRQVACCSVHRVGAAELNEALASKQYCLVDLLKVSAVTYSDACKCMGLELRGGKKDYLRWALTLMDADTLKSLDVIKL